MGPNTGSNCPRQLSDLGQIPENTDNPVTERAGSVTKGTSLALSGTSDFLNELNDLLGSSSRIRSGVILQ